MEKDTLFIIALRKKDCGETQGQFHKMVSRSPALYLLSFSRPAYIIATDRVPVFSAVCITCLYVSLFYYKFARS